MRMICENANKCGNVGCEHRKPHEQDSECLNSCDKIYGGSIAGSKCIPYKEKAVGYRFTDVWGGVHYNDIAQKLPKCNDAYRLFAEFVKANGIGTSEENLQWIVDHPDALEFAIEQGWVERVNTKWDGLFLKKDENKGTTYLADTKSGKNLLYFEENGACGLCVNADGGDGKFDSVGRLIIY